MRVNYWPRWIRAIRGKTLTLSMAQMGAYDRLLDYYYEEERPLPHALEACNRIAGASTKQDRLDVSAVLATFFTLTARGWEQARSEAEIAIAQPKIAAARANGGNGGRPKGSKKKPTGLLEETADEPPPKAPHPQSSSLRSEPPLAPEGAEDGFDEWWKTYPAFADRKAAKPQCLAKWKAKGFARMRDRLLSALRAQKASDKWREDGGKWIPAPLTWLSQERWTGVEEAPPEVRSTPTTGALAKLEAERMTPEQKAASDIVRRQVMASIKTIGKAA